VKLVVDASVAVAASANPLGFARFRRFELLAPPLMWIEAQSVLHAIVTLDRRLRRGTERLGFVIGPTELD
jgi:hypothetical protein